MDKKVFGKIFLSLRKEKGLTQAKLAEDLGVTELTIRRWEHGESFPTEVNLDAIAEYFEKSITELFDGGDSQSYISSGKNESKNSMNIIESVDGCDEQQHISEQEPGQDAATASSQDEIMAAKIENAPNVCMSEIKKGRRLFVRTLICSSAVIGWGVVNAETKIWNGVKQDRLFGYPILCLFSICLLIGFAKDFFSPNDKHAKRIAQIGTIVMGFLCVLWAFGLSFIRS